MAAIPIKNTATNNLTVTIPTGSSASTISIVGGGGGGGRHGARRPTGTPGLQRHPLDAGATQPGQPADAGGDTAV